MIVCLSFFIPVNLEVALEWRKGNRKENEMRVVNVFLVTLSIRVSVIFLS